MPCRRAQPSSTASGTTPLDRAPIGKEFTPMSVKPVPAEFEDSGRVGHPIHDGEYTEALQVFSERFSRTQGLGPRTHVRSGSTITARARKEPRDDDDIQRRKSTQHNT